MEEMSCVRLLADQEQLKGCRSKIKAGQGSFTQLSKILDLAGNEVRLKIVYLLQEEGELCPCDLSDILEMTIPAISQHLRKLRDGGIVQTRKVGQTIFYSLSPLHLPILSSLFEHITLKRKKLSPI